MKREIIIPQDISVRLHGHLFQNDFEQAAFLFAEFEILNDTITVSAKDAYMVPPEGWDVQMDVHLQMKDEERAKILKMARDKNLALIDCHSHPHADEDVWFSGSDVNGTTEFASYVNWKLGGKPFTALVFGENSADAVMWHGDFQFPAPVSFIHLGSGDRNKLVPKGSWFNRRFWKNRYEQE